MSDDTTNEDTTTEDVAVDDAPTEDLVDIDDEPTEDVVEEEVKAKPRQASLHECIKKSREIKAVSDDPLVVEAKKKAVAMESAARQRCHDIVQAGHKQLGVHVANLAETICKLEDINPQSVNNAITSFLNK